MENEKYSKEIALMNELQNLKIKITLKRVVEELEDELDKFLDFHQGDFQVRFFVENMKFDIKNVKKEGYQHSNLYCNKYSNN